MAYVLLGVVLLCLASIAGGLVARTRLAATGVDTSSESEGTNLCPVAWRRWSSLARAVLGPDRWLVSGAMWLMLLDTALALAAPWPVKIVIDQILAHRLFPAVLAPLRHLGPLPATMCVAIVGLALLAAGAVVGYLVGYLTTSLAERTAARLRLATMSHLLRIPPESVAEYPIGEMASRVGSDTGSVSDTLVTVVETLVPEAGLLAGMGVITGLLDWRLTLTAFAVIPLFVITARLRNRSVKEAARLSRARAGELGSHTTDALSRLPAVHVFGQALTELRAFRHVSERSARATIKAVDAGARYTPITDTLPGVALAAALIVGALEVESGRISLGSLVLFLAYLSSLTAPVHALARLAATLARGVASRERLRELIKIRPLTAAPSAPSLPRGVSTMPTCIDVDKVSVLRHGAHRIPAGLTFHIDPGEFVCLTGPSGVGKTTILSLLCGLNEQTAGHIRIGGRDLAAIPPTELRELITLVPQDPWLHTGSIADNIRYGRPDASAAELHATAERAGAAEFIGRLPNGYDTAVGEHGHRLSGGQQRRIALARALLCNTPILLLDEPTAGLDRHGQNQLIATLRFITDRTVLAATHHGALAQAAHRTIDLGPPLTVHVPALAHQQSNEPIDRLTVGLPSGVYAAAKAAAAKKAPPRALERVRLEDFDEGRK